jgi:pilus assembly protein Flp/PilA
VTKLALRFAQDTSGATAIEYSLAAVMMAVAVIGGMTVLGPPVKALFESIVAAFPTVN